MQMILDLLKASDADAWEITSTQTEGWEFYFIRHSLDQNRVRNVKHDIVKVYKKSEDGKFLGSASGEIYPTATEAEAKQMIDRLIFQASLVRNPYYELNQPKAATEKGTESFDIAQTAKDFIDTVKGIHEDEKSDINSYEIFVSNIKRRFINSNGIDVTSEFPSSMIETVVNARNNEHEIELYRMYNSGTCDKEGLKNDITETMRYGIDRLSTCPTPNLGDYPVIFSTDAAVQIYSYFIDRMNAAYKYQSISDWETGRDVVEDVQGDRITAKIVRELKNSSANASYDTEGAPVRDLTLIENGVARNFWGSRQFSQYLSLEDSFIGRNFAIDGGHLTEEEIRDRDYLEIVEFSDFQVNAVTGDIAGEIRLAYLHKDGSTTAVSSGSATGNMRDMAKKLYASRELRQYNNILIPKVTLLDGLTITGNEE